MKHSPSDFLLIHKEKQNFGNDLSNVSVKTFKFTINLIRLLNVEKL